MSPAYENAICVWLTVGCRRSRGPDDVCAGARTLRSSRLASVKNLLITASFGSNLGKNDTARDGTGPRRPARAVWCGNRLRVKGVLGRGDASADFRGSRPASPGRGIQLRAVAHEE